MKNKIAKPTRVLCKRSLTSGEDHWWDGEGTIAPPDHPKRHEREKHMFIEGQWYDIIERGESKSSFGTDEWFKVIDSQGHPHSHSVYSEESKKNFPSHCDMYGPSDYAKWFYTPDELKEVEAGTYNPSYKKKHAITVLPGNYHWVKLKEEDGGEWVIAQCRSKLKLGENRHGKHYWDLMRNSGVCKTDDYFENIGHRVDSMTTQLDKKDRIENLEELQEAIFPMIDSWKAEGTEEEKWHAPLEYHKQFVTDAVSRYFDKSFSKYTDDNLFF